MSCHAGCLSSHLSRGPLVLHSDPAGGCRRLREGQQRGSMLEKIGERGWDLCVGLRLRFTPLQQVGSRSSWSVRTSREDLGDRGGGRRGRQRRRMGNRYSGFGFGVGRRGRGGAWQRGGAARGGRGDVKVFRVSQLLVFWGEVSLGLSVLLQWVFHLLIDGLTLV